MSTGKVFTFEAKSCNRCCFLHLTIFLLCPLSRLGPACGGGRRHDRHVKPSACVNASSVM